MLFINKDSFSFDHHLPHIGNISVLQTFNSHLKLANGISVLTT